MVDSGLLSLAPIIEASRAWICIRPLTYEDKVESDYLRQIYSPRGGLENTVFALMDPDAKRYLARPGRGPYEVWRDCFERPQSMVEGLAKLSAEFKTKAEPTALPTVASVRFALNVAACDNRPLAIAYTASASASDLELALATHAWKPKMMGQFVYVTTSDKGQLSSVTGFDGKEGVYFVQPDEFGVKGSVIAFGTAAELESTMTAALLAFKAIDQTDHRGHLARGVRQGIRWKPLVPVEDRQADEATKRLWGG